MPNPFGKNGGPVNSVPRNTSDLSHQVNGTYHFGGLYPVACIPVLPGDSFKINTTFGLRFMPTAFPLQTRMRADIHAFYVRNRNLWKDWPDFYGKTKENLVPPYIKGDGVNVSLKTGGLADHLNVPTTIVGDYGNGTKVTSLGIRYLKYRTSDSYVTAEWRMDYQNQFASFPKSYNTWNTSGGPNPTPNVYIVDVPYTDSPNSNRGPVKGFLFRVDRSGDFKLHITLPPSFLTDQIVSQFYSLVVFCSSDADAVLDGSSSAIHAYYGCVVDEATCQLGTFRIIANSISFEPSPDIDWTKTPYIYIGLSSNPDVAASELSPSVTTSGPSDSSITAVDFISSDSYVNPFDQTKRGTLPLSALPFRAYESIYNSFYRDERNNPYIIDGEKEYNRYIPSTDGGLDNNEYKIRFRNWEQDFLTTAVPTPQQGVAPLVGISSTGVMSISDPDTGQVYQVQAKTADDADTIVGYDVTETLPKAVTRSLVNYASSGISINDFRNVNAYQRWLETNIRRGFKYRDMIKSHFDVDISYQELDMPEFIGGVSIDIMPQTISQTSADSGDNPLGSYAGQLYGSGSSKNSITHYCDEHGYIMLILSVVPVPNYSQLLPKDFLKTDSLDYFSPEFGHIGLQAIPYSEVCPVQVVNDPDSNLTDTFGYQRAWYDYLQLYDTVHGQFRTTLRNFVMNRVFDEKPVLGPSFTTIDPKQLNDVFTVSEVDGEPIDPILGQIYFDIKAKRPIPRYGVPRLE